MNTSILIITLATLLTSSSLQILGICRTAYFRTWESAPGSLLYEFDIPTGWRKVRGPFYIVTGIAIQTGGTIAALLLPQ